VLAEPILTAEDVRVWEMWQRTALLHARTRSFARRVDGAKRIVDAALRVVDPAYVTGTRVGIGWSAGKDSTCLAHLVTVEMGARDVELFSEKDDLDYPGEEDYVRELAAAWGAKLRVVRPDISPAAWIAEHGREIELAGDIHSRRAGLSKACFYSVVERETAHYYVLILGLRAEESYGRRVSRKVRGPLYRVKSGQVRAQPLADWTGLDVLAYAASRGVELLHVYRCVAFMHASAPWMIRKSWWLPGEAAAQGATAWLRRYYPSLYRKAVEWMPLSATLG
jgi:3'-phosphoadenosine 5'-phosphosulfate sulfotransferase (PAPS reductase)/FAD synthetase